jgi:flagellin
MPALLSVVSNLGSSAAIHSLATAIKRSDKAMERLASGNRINSASDDVAGMAVATNLRADLRSYQQAKRNINDALAMHRTAEGGNDQITSLVMRMRELAVQAASDGLTDKERVYLQTEYNDVRLDIDRIVVTTEYNGQKLLDGTGGNGGGTFTFQVDVNEAGGNVLQSTIASHDALGLFNGSISKLLTLSTAQTAIADADGALDQLSTRRTAIGSFINKLETAARHTASVDEHLSQARSQIADADFAQESANYAAAQVLKNAGVSILAQTNQSQNVSLRLLG